MSERYKRLFLLQPNLYAVGLPLIISAGALLLDTREGKTMAQLKMQSIDNRIISSVSVAITELGARGERLGDELSFEYLHLDAKRGDEFGAQAPIPLNNARTSSFSLKVK